MKKIRHYRKAKKMSAEFVGRQLGVSFRTVLNWELGHTEPDASDIRALCKLFGVSADELLKED